MTDHSPPDLVLVAGPAGSGKTTLARRLCRELKMPFYDYDSVCEPFLSALQRREGLSKRSSAFTQAYREACYKAFFDAVFDTISVGLGAVVAAPLAEEMSTPGFFASLREKHGFDFFVTDLCIEIGEDDLRRNITMRGSERDVEKLAQWDEYREQLRERKRLWAPDRSMTIEYRSGAFDEAGFLSLVAALGNR